MFVLFILFGMVFAVDAERWPVYRQTMYPSGTDHCPDFLKCLVNDELVQACSPGLRECTILNFQKSCELNGEYINNVRGAIYVCETKCPSGMMHTNDTVCTTCPNGYYQPHKGQWECLNTQHTQLELNSSVTAADLIVRTGCQTCPEGKVASLASNQCIQTCAPGTYISDTGCENCPVGFFKADRNAFSCNRCPRGKYQDIQGQTICKQCEQGQSTAQHRASCDDCKPGRYQNERGEDACKQCPLGKYNVNNRSTACVFCPAGYYDTNDALLRFNYETGRCPGMACQPGTYQDEHAKSSCKPCESGKYQDLPGSIGCKSCEYGKYQDLAGSIGCKACGGLNTTTLPGWYKMYTNTLTNAWTSNSTQQVVQNCHFRNYEKYNRRNCSEIENEFGEQCTSDSYGSLVCLRLKREYSTCRNEAKGCPHHSCQNTSLIGEDFVDFIGRKCIGEAPWIVGSTYVDNNVWHIAENPC